MTNTIDPISYNAGIEAAGKAAFKKAQSVYRSDYDTFPQTHTWETTTEDVRECWRKIAAAAVASLHRPQTAPDVSKFEKLADAMWQLLDDMGDGHSVSDQAKQEAIAAFAPFANAGRIHSAAPADAERLELAAKLRVAAKIAGNPVYDDILKAAEYLESSRAGGWREDMQS